MQTMRTTINEATIQFELCQHSMLNEAKFVDGKRRLENGGKRAQRIAE
jgi:hypothetical protein